MKSETIFVPLRQETLAAILESGVGSHESIDEKIMGLVRVSEGDICERPPKHDSGSNGSPPFGRYRMELLGESWCVSSLREVLVTVLGILADLDSKFLQQFSFAGGRTRKFVARHREAIYPGRNDLVQYTAEVRPGWWVGTNYSKADVVRILRAACDLSGIEFGVDLKFTF